MGESYTTAKIMAVMYTTGEYVSPSWLEDSVV